MSEELDDRTTPYEAVVIAAALIVVVALVGALVIDTLVGLL